MAPKKNERVRAGEMTGEVGRTKQKKDVSAEGN